MHHLSEGQNFLLGTIAAFIEGMMLQPTLYWKNALAQGLPKAQIYTLDPRILYRGTGISIFNECQMMGFQFAATGLFQRLLQDQSDQGTSLGAGKEVAAAVGGGVVCAMLCSPIELVMIQQQRKGGSVVETVTAIVKNHGFLSHGLMRGFVTAALRDSVYVTGMLAVTPLAQAYLQKPDCPLLPLLLWPVSFFSSSTSSASSSSSNPPATMSPGLASLYASLFGGVAAAIPSHPFDTIKSCMQGDLERTRFTTLSGTLVQLVPQRRGLVGGVRRLFQGGLMRTFNITATVYVANECRIRMSPFISAIDL